MYMYIAWIQIHGTAEPWKCGIPSICIIHIHCHNPDSWNYRIMEMWHKCVYVCSINPDSWNCRTMETWWPTYMYITWMYIARIQIHGTADPWKRGNPCILQESRFMELQNRGNMVTYVCHEYTYIVYSIYGTM